MGTGPPILLQHPKGRQTKGAAVRDHVALHAGIMENLLVWAVCGDQAMDWEATNPVCGTTMVSLEDGMGGHIRTGTRELPQKTTEEENGNVSIILYVFLSV